MNNIDNRSSLQETFRLPCGFSATFICRDPYNISVEWTPDVPQITKARPRRKFFEAYGAAKRRFLAKVATLYGLKVGIAELSPDGELTVMCVEPAAKH